MNAESPTLDYLHRIVREHHYAAAAIESLEIAHEGLEFIGFTLT